MYELPLVRNNIAVKHSYTNRSGAKFSLGIYRWGAGLAATGRMPDTGQSFSLTVKQVGAAAQLLPYFVPYQIPPGGLYWKHNTIIILRINYKNPLLLLLLLLLLILLLLSTTRCNTKQSIYYSAKPTWPS